MKRFFLTTFLCMSSLLHADFPDITEEENSLISIHDGVYDLENLYSPFILETKRIEIGDYPRSFNPSIVPWQGNYLMSFRIREGQHTHQIGLVQVDSEMNPISSPIELLVEHPPSARLQDPRLMRIKNQLLLIYSALVPQDHGKEIRRVFVGEVVNEGDAFSLKNPHPLLSYEKENRKRNEKNWTPFSYEDELLLSYTISPHKVFRPLLDENRCETVSLSDEELPWEYGEIRGGTIALKEKGFYLTFFHSSKKLASFQSDKKMFTHYFMGAVTFEDKPPFAIKAISPAPILGENFYTKTDFKTWKPLKAVFPAGLISNEDHLWLLYGKQDSEIWAAKIDKKMLLESLTPIER